MIVIGKFEDAWDRPQSYILTLINYLLEDMQYKSSYLHIQNRHCILQRNHTETKGQGM